MAKKLEFVSAGSFKFNEEVLPGRHPDEQITSVQYIPANGTGKFRTFGPFDPYEEKRGMLNAMTRHFFGMDIRVGAGLHVYGSHNPERVGGALGWISLDRLEQMLGTGVVAGEKALRHIQFPDRNGVYRDTEVMLPHTKEERVASGPKRGSGKIVTIEPTAWLRIVELGGGRLEMSTAPTDTQYSGKQLGVILHSYLEELFEGVALSTSVQITPMIDKSNGQTIWLDKLQNMAKNLRAWAAMPLEEAREAYVADWRARAANSRFINQTAFAATPELEAQVAVIQAATDADELVPQEKQLFVLVDGVSVPIQNVADGFYAIVKYRNGVEIGRDGTLQINPVSRLTKLGRMAALQGARGLSTKLA